MRGSVARAQRASDRFILAMNETKDNAEILEIGGFKCGCSVVIGPRPAGKASCRVTTLLDKQAS